MRTMEKSSNIGGVTVISTFTCLGFFFPTRNQPAAPFSSSRVWYSSFFCGSGGR